MKNKIIFLDLDGVLNSEDSRDSMIRLWELNNSFKSRDEFGFLFDERCVNWLRYIIMKTGAKIVISSTWRSKGLNRMKEMWAKRGLPGEVIDITPVTIDPAIVELYAATNNEADRGYEIQEWIDINQPQKYCIIDDQNDMLDHHNFVKVDKRFGISKLDANKVIALLNQDDLKPGQTFDYKTNSENGYLIP